MTTNYRNETNPIEESEFNPHEDAHQCHWDDRQLHRITRIRLVTDHPLPFWDVSYVSGVMKDGRQAIVSVPFDQLPRRSPVREMVKYARRDGVYLTQLCGGSIHSVVSKLW